MSTRATAAVILLLPSGKPQQLCARAFFKKYLKSFSLYWRKNYHDGFSRLFVANFLNVSRTYELAGTVRLSG
jgi:hypothetical protein